MEVELTNTYYSNMEQPLYQQHPIPSFEIKKTTIIKKVCLTLIILTTIAGLLYSLLGKYNFLLLSLLSYIGAGIPLYLLKQKQLNAAKLWLLIGYTCIIILSTILLGATSYAAFTIIPVPFAAMVFYHKQQYLWRYILLAILGFVLCESIIYCTEPVLDIAFPIINKSISGLAIILVTYLLLDLFKTEVLKNEATLLAKNELLKKEIEERKRIANVLLENEERLKLAIEIANIAVRDINVKTGETFIGEEWCHILGYDKELFLKGDMQLIYLIHEAEKDYVKTLVEDQSSGKIPAFETVFRVYTKSGKIKWIRQLSKTITTDSGGKPLRIIEMYMDVTEQREVNISLE